jgi:hypothetical protein
MNPAMPTRVFALARIAYGAGLIAAPERVARGWIGDDAKRPPVRVAVRALGIRDIALAVGALAFARDGDRVRPWLLAAVGSDCVDVAATLAAGDALTERARAGTALLAGVSALVGAALARAAVETD